MVGELGGNTLIYSEKYKVLFISVPKTGTTSLTAPLMERLEGRRNMIPKGNEWVTVGEHSTLSQIAALVGWDKLKDVTIIGGVRNPWDRVVSAYNFYCNGRVVQRVKAGKRKNIKAILKVLLAKALPFSLWVYIYKTPNCFDYLCDDSGELRAYIIHLENMNMEVPKVCEKLGIPPFTPGKENVSSRKPYKSYYNSRTEALVMKRFNKDVNTFDYGY